MQGLQKIGGIAAITEGLLFILFPVFLFAILPAQGLAAGPNVLADPRSVLPAAAQSPTVAIFGFLDVLVGVALLLVVLALHERLQTDSPVVTRIATTSGLAAALLFLAVGMGRFTNVSQLANLYSQDPTGVATAYLAASTAIEGLNNGATFAFGWWVVLISWAGLRPSGLPKFLNYLGLLLGATNIITFLLPIPPLLGIVWFLWLGVVLLRVGKMQSAG